MEPEVDVLYKYTGKDPDRPEDPGRRWQAFCLTCQWHKLFVWKGGYRLAWAAAHEHECCDGPAACGGCGGDLRLEPWPPWEPVDHDEPQLWTGTGQLMRVGGRWRLVHDDVDCIGCARIPL
jgi:hypothetical protein